MATMTVSEARAALPQVLDRVAEGEQITITRHGRPVAVVVRPDIMWSRRTHAVMAEAERIHQMLEEAAAAPLSEGVGLAPGEAERLVAEIRADRDAE
jgi:antitoxin (DNA-binding transcriptional repressor) of toxin-antitoxin stability system